MATAGNLMFHGTSVGRLIAYSADKCGRPWKMTLGVRKMASPISYGLDGKKSVEEALAQ